MTNLKRIYKPCERCKGTGKLKIRNKYIQSKDIKKILLIMKKYKLNQLAMAKVLNITQGTLNGWLHGVTKGKIKSIYFEILKMRGYK